MHLCLRTFECANTLAHMGDVCFYPCSYHINELARSLAPRLCEEVPVCVLTLLALPGLPMGCASSKDDKADASPTDVNPAVGGSAAHKGPTTHTGYHSDVEAGQKHAFTEQLVTNNMHQIGEIYDLSHSTTLGRGAYTTHVSRAAAAFEVQPSCYDPPLVIDASLTRRRALAVVRRLAYLGWATRLVGQGYAPCDVRGAAGFLRPAPMLERRWKWERVVFNNIER